MLSRTHLLRQLASGAVTFALLSLTACNIPATVNTLKEAVAPHERYARGLRAAGLAESAMGREWLFAADTVLNAAHRITLPFHESGYYDRSEARAVGWRFSVRDGQRIEVTVNRDGQPAQIFTDLFVVTGDSVAPFRRVAFAAQDSAMRYDTRDSATYVLRVQPELLRGGRYDIAIRSNPQLSFPVQGRGNSAAQSFFGSDRDAGERRHEGVDIFAPRGTPVLAATDGEIVSISPNKLGGNVIWERDDHRAQTLYYAHLDHHAVTAGVHVEAGDTIGFVGNTGNAATTAPHLHFGIYRRPGGAIDPWPYVRRESAELPDIRGDTSRIGRHAVIRTAAITVRRAGAKIGFRYEDSARRAFLDCGGGWWILPGGDGWWRCRIHPGQQRHDNGEVKIEFSGDEFQTVPRDFRGSEMLKNFRGSETLNAR